ncbi:hypothetical protein AB4156_20350 [Cupriavidus sp. 2MCAB6]|uniref:hypothetical protein n=1 Tax=Cupriavidus sp. 2MCAB6 TaxID=3232981 RepID=UPI003F8F0F51
MPTEPGKNLPPHFPQSIAPCGFSLTAPAFNSALLGIESGQRLARTKIDHALQVNTLYPPLPVSILRTAQHAVQQHATATIKG